MTDRLPDPHLIQWYSSAGIGPPDMPNRGLRFRDAEKYMYGFSWVGYIHEIVTNEIYKAETVWHNNEIVWTRKNGWIDSFLAIKIADHISKTSEI